MKKLPKYLSIIGSAMLVWGAFSVPEALAAELYLNVDTSTLIMREPTDNTIFYDHVGIPSPVAINTGVGPDVEIQFTFWAASLSGTTTLRVGLAKVSQASNLFSCGLDIPISQFMTYYYATSSCQIGGVTAIAIGDPLTIQFTQPTATGFYIVGEADGTPYGIITDDGGVVSSFPAFGSDSFLTGVSTTTQQAYCAKNFATTTGFLDSLGQSISVGVCNVGAFLFLPDVNTLAAYQNLPDTMRTKIPFSYYYDLYDAVSSSTASTTANFTPMTVDLRGTGVGSTTPWATVLPASFGYLSSTTIMTYVSQSAYDLFFLLMRSAIWLAVLFHVYHRLVPRHVTHV